MRLLYVVHQFPPQYATGTEILTLETAKAVQALGHEVEILAAHLVNSAPDPGAPLTSEFYQGIRVHRYPYHQPNPVPGQSPFRAEYRNEATLHYFDQVVAASKPDIVHAFHLYRMSALVLEFTAARRIPMLFTITDFWTICPAIDLRLPDGKVCGGPEKNSANCVHHLCPGEPKPWGVGKPAWLGTLWASRKRHRAAGEPLAVEHHVAELILRQPYFRRVLPTVERLIVPSAIIRKKLLAFGIPEKKLHMLPFGINFSYLKTLEDRTPSTRLRVGYIGTISHPKGLHVLLRAFRLLPADLPVELKVYGRPSDQPAYYAQMIELAAGDPRVAFLGAFPNSQIGEVLRGIDVLVVPSVWLENTPLVISTAQAARVPVLASDLEGMTEQIVHGSNGLLFPVGDQSALASCLLDLASNPARVRTLAASCRTPPSIEEYATSLCSIYSKTHRQSLDHR